MTYRSFIVLVIAVLAPAGSSEESDQKDIREAIESGGRRVTYGRLMSEADRRILDADLGLARRTGEASCILAYFEDSSLGILNSLARTRPEISREAWLERFKLAITKPDEEARSARTAVRFGVATYRRWRLVVTEEPRVRIVKREKLILGRRMEWHEPETYMARVESRIPLPSRHQVYLAIRLH